MVARLWRMVIECNTQVEYIVLVFCGCLLLIKCMYGLRAVPVSNHERIGISCLDVAC